jgi:cytochrome P450
METLSTSARSSWTLLVLPTDVRTIFTLGLASQLTVSAASDTAVAALGMFFIAMMRWPDVQRKAQEHLDRVLEGRLPKAMDEHNEKLSYITALVRELIRCEATSACSASF